MVVYGGYSGSYSSAVYHFNVESSSWRRAEPVGEAPRGRQGATLTRRAGSFILFGGADDVQPYNDVHVLSLDGKSWMTPKVGCAPAPCQPPAPREGHSVALVGKKLWIFGGVGRV